MHNLLDEGFIRCFFEDGTQKELGLLDTFRQSKSIVRIGGDTDIQEVALLRLLLAIMYRALPEVTDSTDWAELWDDGLPRDVITEYLEEYRNRFDLFSAETPFYQIVDAQFEGKREPSNQYLLLDFRPFNTKVSLHSNFSMEGLGKLDFSFAARKLIELQAFSFAYRIVIKGDPRQKKRSYGQPGWLGNGSTVHFLGKNLEKTLLLNFVPYSELNIDYEDDLAVWEREKQTSSPEGLHGDMDESRIPTGPADLYTHQASRVSLIHDGSYVISSVVGIGDRLFKYDMQSKEPMMAWRSIVRTGNDSAATTYVPVKQSAGKEAWRSINGLLGSSAHSKGPQRAPAIARHISTVSQEVESEFSAYVPIVVTTVFYGTQDSFIEHQTVSELDLSVDALKDNGEARSKLIRGLEIAEKHIYFYNLLLSNLLVAEGKERSPAKGISSVDMAKAQMHDFIQQIGVLYKEWIAEVTDENSDRKLREWIDTVFDYTKKAADETVLNASRRAIAGRMEDPAKPDSHINAAKAHNIFMSIMYKERKGMIDD